MIGRGSGLNHQMLSVLVTVLAQQAHSSTQEQQCALQCSQLLLQFEPVVTPPTAVAGQTMLRHGKKTIKTNPEGLQAQASTCEGWPEAETSFNAPLRVV